MTATNVLFSAPTAFDAEEAKDLSIIGHAVAGDATASAPQITTFVGQTHTRNDAISVSADTTIDGLTLTVGLWYFPEDTGAGAANVSQLVQVPGSSSPGGAVDRVAGVLPIAGDVPIAALIAALDAVTDVDFLTNAEKAIVAAITNAGSGQIITAAERTQLVATVAAQHSHSNQAVLDAITNVGSGQIITAAERANLIAAFADVTNQADIQSLLGVAAGTAQLPAIPAGSGAIVPAGDLATQIAVVKAIADAGGGLGPDLVAIEALATTGIAERTGPDTWVTRAIGLLVNNLVERSARGGIVYGDTGVNSQIWVSDEHTDQSWKLRYGANDGVATDRFTLTPAGVVNVLAGGDYQIDGTSIRGVSADANNALSDGADGKPFLDSSALSGTRIVATAALRDAEVNLTAGEKLIVLDVDGQGNRAVYEIAIAGATFAAATTIRTEAPPVLSVIPAPVTAESPNLVDLKGHATLDDTLLLKRDDNSGYNDIGAAAGSINISSLPAATTPLVGNELVPIEQGGNNRQVAASELGGTPIPAGAIGSVFIQSTLTDDTRVHLEIPGGFTFSNAGNGELVRIRFTLPSEVLSAGLSVNAGSAEFTASIDSGPGTASTPITGIENIAANTVAITNAAATANQNGTAGQYFVVALSNVAAAVSGFVDFGYRWTGV